MKPKYLSFFLTAFLLMTLFPAMSSMAAAYSIRDDQTGGDCSLIGLWDAETNTCTLTRDVSETVLIESDNIIIDGDNHSLAGNGGYGIYLNGRRGAVIKNFRLSGFSTAIYLLYSENNTITGNAISGCNDGIYFLSSNINTVEGNHLENNSRRGIYIGGSYNIINNNIITSSIFGLYISGHYNSVTDNNISDNAYGIYLYYHPRENRIYNNNFINNRTQAFNSVYLNYFNMEKPLGGNYWSDFDTPDKGCHDENADGFCDNPFFFTGGIDYLPWAKANGWKDTTPPEVSISVSPDILWPPNHKMVDIKIEGFAEDKESGLANVLITVDDEYNIYNLEVEGFGSTVKLEAWRDGKDMDGRHYTITAVAVDNAGNKSVASTEVLVPHDMRR